jgi:monoterpene epsilon-lactone hydrolase
MGQFTRDGALSSVVATHAALVARCVDGQLHVWDGFGNAFFYDPDLRESRDAHAVTIKFFDAHLGAAAHIPSQQKLTARTH